MVGGWNNGGGWDTYRQHSLYCTDKTFLDREIGATKRHTKYCRLDIVIRERRKTGARGLEINKHIKAGAQLFA